MSTQSRNAHVKKIVGTSTTTPVDWKKDIDVRDFVFKKAKPFTKEPTFLVGPSKKTRELWNVCEDLLKKEQNAPGGVLAIDSETVSTIASHGPGYIQKDLEVVVGLQTDAPLKRGVKPMGGIRVVEKACEENGQSLSPKIYEQFTFRKTHNDGVFSAYTDEMRTLRKTGILTGLPDAYARGRIIGDYRRVALYGVDRLIEAKKRDLTTHAGPMSDERIRLREEITDQITALTLLKTMALSYGFDISEPANNAREAVQWTYFAYLATIKEHDGAAMSIGNIGEFLDIYIEQDIKKGLLTEEEAQELIDQLVIKLRLVRHLRAQEYNALFAGDPTWVTVTLGGMWCDGRTKVTKTSYRFLQTLYNLGPSPEPNITVMWSTALPKAFKEFCAQTSIDTSAIQYENDTLMQECSGSDDSSISCCVSRLTTGKEMQFFGARCNLAKILLLALNAGRDEVSGVLIVPGIEPLKGTVLKYDEVLSRFKQTMAYVAGAYTDTMNLIHYMHDKYFYERAQMALVDSDCGRIMAFGIAGLSVVADSLSAIKYAEVKVIRDERKLTKDFVVVGDFPLYGNDDARVDKIAGFAVQAFDAELKKHAIYRDAEPTLSVLTITSNVVYGKKTGATPDGRKAGVAFAPGANPMHGRDTSGAISSLNSVASLDYRYARDGISNTFTVTPPTLGPEPVDRRRNLAQLLDGYFTQGAHHLNVNVLNRETLVDAIAHPELYPQLTIRVSGYAVNFVKLSREQQQEVLARTFFTTL
jgi:formate C-acetyltransferase